MQAQSQYGYLDNIRKNHGAEKCKTAFSQSYQRNKAGAIALVNDPRLSFPCLFVLWPLIDSLGLHRRLKPRHMLVLSLCRQFLKPGSSTRSGPVTNADDAARKALKWMLETGYAEDGLNPEFDQILDVTAALLLSIFRDSDALKHTVELIFLRAKKNGYIHDLVWALFKSRDTLALKLVAERLPSENAQEAELAKELLNLDELDEVGSENDPTKQYAAYIEWLENNDPYLYFTQEGFQYSSKPVFSAVDVERKYLQKANPAHTKAPLVPASEQEAAILATFKPLSKEEKALLSAYSQRKKKENASEWESWIRSSLAEQIDAMQPGKEDFV
ncbi:MAG: hypothetical protein AAGU74_05940 [Bacillota bacterium]